MCFFLNYESPEHACTHTVMGYMITKYCPEQCSDGHPLLDKKTIYAFLYVYIFLFPFKLKLMPPIHNMLINMLSILTLLYFVVLRLSREVSKPRECGLDFFNRFEI